MFATSVQLGCSYLSEQKENEEQAQYVNNAKLNSHEKSLMWCKAQQIRTKDSHGFDYM